MESGARVSGMHPTNRPVLNSARQWGSNKSYHAKAQRIYAAGPLLEVSSCDYGTNDRKIGPLNGGTLIDANQVSGITKLISVD
jgi:hypothetical protein